MSVKDAGKRIVDEFIKKFNPDEVTNKHIAMKLSEKLGTKPSASTLEKILSGSVLPKDLNKLFHIYSRIETILELRPYTLSDLVEKYEYSDKNSSIIPNALIGDYHCYWISINDEKTVSKSDVNINDKTYENIKISLSNGEILTGNITYNDGILHIKTINEKQKEDTWRIVMKWRAIGQSTVLAGIMIGFDQNLHPFSRKLIFFNMDEHFLDVKKMIEDYLEVKIDLEDKLEVAEVVAPEDKAELAEVVTPEDKAELVEVVTPEDKAELVEVKKIQIIRSEIPKFKFQKKADNDTDI